MISIRRVARALNVPLDEWQFMPDAICFGMIRKRFVNGTIIYGKFKSDTYSDKCWRKNNPLYETDNFHCWIKSCHNEIIDPTLFTLNDSDPKIDIKHPDLFGPDKEFYEKHYMPDGNVDPHKVDCCIARIPGKFNTRRKPIRLFIEDVQTIGFLQSISSYNGKSIDLSNLFYLCQMPIEILNHFVVSVYDAVIRAGFDYMISECNFRIYRKISQSMTNECVS